MAVIYPQCMLLDCSCIFVILHLSRAHLCSDSNLVSCVSWILMVQRQGHLQYTFVRPFWDNAHVINSQRMREYVVHQAQKCQILSFTRPYLLKIQANVHFRWGLKCRNYKLWTDEWWISIYNWPFTGVWLTVDVTNHKAKSEQLFSYDKFLERFLKSFWEKTFGKWINVMQRSVYQYGKIP